MKKRFLAMMGLGTAFVLTMSGCGFSGEQEVAVTPTPTVAATPTPVPTSTPTPTPTPLPRLIGVKNADAKMIYLTNSLETDLRELYVMESGEDDWGRSLIGSESLVKAAEQVRMYYAPYEAEEGEEEIYDLKITTKDGDTYEIYSVELGDMEKASLDYDEEDGIAYLRYMSLSTKKEMDTKENSQQTESADSSDYDYDETEYYYYEEETYNYSYDNSYDDSSDSYTEDVVTEGSDGYDTSTDAGSSDSEDDTWDDWEDSTIDDELIYDPSEDDLYDSSEDYSDAGTDIPWEEYADSGAEAYAYEGDGEEYVGE